MPDSLRTRIAAVLVQHHTTEDRDCKWPLQCECDAGWRNPEEWARHVADAVIRELKLREERTVTELVTDPYSGATWRREGGHRYVTDWIADE